MDFRPGREKRKDKGMSDAGKRKPKTWFWSCSGRCSLSKHGTPEGAKRCIEIAQRKQAEKDG